MCTLDTPCETKPNTSHLLPAPTPSGTDSGDRTGTWPFGPRGSPTPTPCPGSVTWRDTVPLFPLADTAQRVPASVPRAMIVPEGDGTWTGAATEGAGPNRRCSKAATIVARSASDTSFPNRTAAPNRRFALFQVAPRLSAHPGTRVPPALSRTGHAG